MAKKQVPVLEGFFTMDAKQPHLIGTQCKSCGSYYFPKQTLFCKNPACNSETFDEVQLSRTGKVWSFTNACYQPPEPFVSPDPFVPYTIVAVELAKEKMIVLGQATDGTNVSDLKAGMDMELVLEPMYGKEDDIERMTWKWKPVTKGAAL
jgi:uncharacterized OB-fold protein